MTHTDEAQGRPAPALPPGYTAGPCPRDPRITVYRRGCNGHPRGFTVEGRPILYLIPDVGWACDKHLRPDGYQPLDVSALLHRRILEEARPVLDDYLERHRDSTAFYHTDRFWKQALGYAGYPSLETPRFTLYSELEQNPFLLLTSRYGYYARYHPWEDTLSYTCIDTDSPTLDREISPFAFAYGEDRANQIIARRQAREGHGPAALEELTRLAAFVHGKHTVRIIFEDGTQRGTPRRSRVEGLASVLDVEDKEIVANRDLFGYGAQLPAAIAHGSRRVEVNMEALREVRELLGWKEPMTEEERDAFLERMTWR